MGGEFNGRKERQDYFEATKKEVERAFPSRTVEVRAFPSRTVEVGEGAWNHLPMMMRHAA
jgi:hypothetical protein